MAPWILSAAIAGGSSLLGFLGQKDANASAERIANTPRTEARTNQSQSTFAPAEMARALYGMLGGIGNQMGATPTPYFPGQGYIGPSAPTQAGMNMGMGALGQYGQGAGMYGAAAGMAPGVANAYGNAAGMAPGVANAYGAASGMGQGVANAYGNAAGMGQGVANAYGDAASIGAMGLPLYGMAAMQGLGAGGSMGGLLGMSGRNYGQLSTAADVANNPWVQNQISANERSVNKNLLENVLPQLSGSSLGAGMLGSSADALMKGRAIGDAAGNLANTNASTMLGAYGQGLGAQQNALGYTGQMLRNQMAPAEATSWAAGQGNAAMNQAGQMAGYRNQGMNAVGNAASYANQGMNAMGTAANYAGQGMDAMGRGADYAGQGMNAMGQGANMFGLGGAMLDQGGQTGLNYGQVAEGYQQRALDDAMSRFQYQYAEPWNRANQINGIIGALSPLGVQYNNSAGTGSQSGQVSPQGSPWMAAGQGALGGGLLGYSMYKNGAFGNNQSNSWLGSGTPQQQVGRYNTGMMTNPALFPQSFMGRPGGSGYTPQPVGPFGY
jgi:hypothetical protein